MKRHMIRGILIVFLWTVLLLSFFPWFRLGKPEVPDYRGCEALPAYLVQWATVLCFLMKKSRNKLFALWAAISAVSVPAAFYHIFGYWLQYQNIISGWSPDPARTAPAFFLAFGFSAVIVLLFFCYLCLLYLPHKKKDALS